MNITTRLNCNPSECDTARTNGYLGLLSMFTQHRDQDMKPNHVVDEVTSAVVACDGLLYPEVTMVSSETCEQTVIQLCSAYIAEATVTIRTTRQ